MNYQEARKYLSIIQEKGAKLTLNNIQTIIDNLTFKFQNINFIQVAGTNGKGSTAHFITSILSSAKYEVGIFTSPHLQDIRERIIVNNKWISKKDFAESLSFIKRIIENLLAKKIIKNIPTFFEHLFLISLYHFHKKKIDFAVLEVGLGGRLDATSTIKPEVAIITNISYDHTKTLGRRIKDIAREKAGIIKKETPVICGCSPNSVANKVIKEIAKQKNANYFNVLNSTNILEIAENKHAYKCSYVTESDNYRFEVFLNGRHQVKNAITAVKAAEVLKRKGFNISKNSIYNGIESISIPGRIEVINSSPKIILDSGHNVEGIKALKDYLKQKNINNLTLVFGVLRDKNYKKMISLLLPYIDRVVLTEPISKRALPISELKKCFSDKSVYPERDLSESLKIAKEFNKKILITGSIYLAGEMRNIIFGGSYNE